MSRYVAVLYEPGDTVLFSSRYGVVNRQGVGSTWRSRHVPSRKPDEDWDVAAWAECRCPGVFVVRADQGWSSDARKCWARATQEDALCNECRDWCWALKPDRVYVRLVDV